MKKTITALDFGTGKVVALIAEVMEGEGKQCDIVGAGIQGYDGYMGKAWNVPEKVNDAILGALHQAEQQANAGRTTKVHVGVPAAFCTVRTVEVRLSLQGADPKVTENDVQSILEKASLQLGYVQGGVILRSPAWFSVDGGKHTLEPVGTHGYELSAKVSFIIAAEFFLNEITNRLASMKIAVESFVPSPAGQTQLFIPSENRDNIAVLIDVGYLNTEVIIVEGDAIVFMRTIPLGGCSIAVDLAYGLEIPLDSAEQVKRAYVYGSKTGQSKMDVTQKDGSIKAVPRSEIEPIIEARAEEICEKVREAIDESGITLRTWSTVYLTGGGLAINRGGREFAAGKIKTTIRELPEKTVKLSSPAYTSTLGALDLMIDAMKRSQADSGKIRKNGFFRNLFGN